MRFGVFSEILLYYFTLKAEFCMEDVGGVFL
jgi:hypothetical protein